MVGLYETAVDELATWHLDNQEIKPKIVASTDVRNSIRFIAKSQSVEE